MKLNPIDICSSDVPLLADLFVKHFAYEVLQAGRIASDGDRVGPEFAMLLGTDGSSLAITEIMTSGEPAYPTDFPFGIMMDTATEVVANHSELTAAGRRPETVNSFEAVGSTWTSCF